jgi:hypothetical protein
MKTIDEIIKRAATDAASKEISNLSFEFQRILPERLSNIPISFEWEGNRYNIHLNNIFSMSNPAIYNVIMEKLKERYIELIKKNIIEKSINIKLNI